MNEYHDRKRTRLDFYDYAQNGAYFVTVCVQDRRPLLSKILVRDNEPLVQLTPLGDIVRRYIDRISAKYPFANVDASVLMPDHLHFLLRFDAAGGDVNLGQIMGWLKYQTAKECNAILSAQGERFWQRSYYDHVIRNNQDYQEIWQYIENNPRKWALDRNMI